MFSINKILTQVRYYAVNDKYVIYKDLNNQFIFKDSVIDNKILDDLILYNNIVFYNFNNNIKVYNLNSKKSKSINGFSILNSHPFSNSYGIILNNQNESLYLLDKNKLVKIKLGIYEYNWGLIFFLDKNILIQDKNNISFFSIKKDSPLWQFNLEQLGSYYNQQTDKDEHYKVVKFLGNWQNNLLVACSNGLLLSLNINTGTIQHKWQHINNFMFDDVIKNKLPRAESFVLDNDTLIGALNKFYFKINLNTSQLSFYNLEDELKKYNIFHIKMVNDNPVTDKHIYLTAMMRQKDNNTKWSYDCIIALNKKTLKIDWHYPFETSSLGTNIPKIANNKLYQLDNDNNLHIFEKTVNETT